MNLSVDQLVQEYLLHSYLYYIKDNAVLPDSYYDSVCSELLNKLDSVPKEFRDIIDKDSMSASTGHHISISRYPQHIKDKAATYD